MKGITIIVKKNGIDNKMKIADLQNLSI